MLMSDILPYLSKLDPRIGVLQHADGISFYAYVNGHHAPETRGTLNEVEIALGVPLTTVVEEKVERIVERQSRRILKTYRPGENKLYAVNCVPQYPGWFNGGYDEGWTEEVEAPNKKAAISWARRHMRHEYMRPDGPLIWSAVQVDEWIDLDLQ